jgi:hypothetical protein
MVPKYGTKRVAVDKITPLAIGDECTQRIDHVHALPSNRSALLHGRQLKEVPSITNHIHVFDIIAVALMPALIYLLQQAKHDRDDSNESFEVHAL